MRLTRKTPAEVETMPELRAQIDHLDRELIALLAERQRHIDRAAQLKPALGWPARIDERVEEVVAKVEATAEELEATLPGTATRAPGSRPSSSEAMACAIAATS